MSTRRHTSCALLVAAALAGAALAADDPAAPCAAAKLMASAAAVAKRLRCEAVAARTGGRVARRCVLRADQRLAQALAAADTAGGCIAVNEPQKLVQEIERGVAAGRDGLRPQHGPSRCARRMLEALGTRAEAVIAAQGRHVRNADAAAFVAAVATAQDTFEVAAAKALRKGDCARNVDPATKASQQDTIAETMRTLVLPPLRALAAPGGRRIGAAVQAGYLADEPDYVSVLAREFSSVTAEHQALWIVVHPAPDVWDFTALDAILAFAEAHDMQLRGHHLLWSQLPYIPDYVKALPPDELRAEVERYFRTVVGRYKGRMATWVVVNEAVATFGGGLQTGPWLDKLGPGYIADAFRLAHEIDPDAELIYNDFFADEINGKSDFIYAMMQDLLAQGVPIHGIGFQMHRFGGPPSPTLRENLQRFADLGLRVQLTEMDVMTAGYPGGLADQLRAQADVYHDGVAACLAVSRCEAVTFWGFTDKHSWIDTFFAPNLHPLPFDEQYRPKPAYFGVRDALLGR